MITVAMRNLIKKFTFVVSPIGYEEASAGTAKDNPSMFEDQAPITEVNYYKNRLFFITSVGTMYLSSQAGKINNLFLKHSLTVSAMILLTLLLTAINVYLSMVLLWSTMVWYCLVNLSSIVLTTLMMCLTSSTASVTKIANYTFDPSIRSYLPRY